MQMNSAPHGLAKGEKGLATSCAHAGAPSQHETLRFRSGYGAVVGLGFGRSRLLHHASHSTAICTSRRENNGHWRCSQGHLVITGQLLVTMHDDQGGVYKDWSRQKAVIVVRSSF